MNKGIIVHDYLNNFGGGEKLVKILAEQKKFKIITFFAISVIVNKFFPKFNLFIINKLPLPVAIKKFFLINYFKKFKVPKSQNCIVSGNYSLFSNLNSINNIFYF